MIKQQSVRRSGGQGKNGKERERDDGRKIRKIPQARANGKGWNERCSSASFPRKPNRGMQGDQSPKSPETVSCGGDLSDVQISFEVA